MKMRGLLNIIKQPLTCNYFLRSFATCSANDSELIVDYLKGEYEGVVVLGLNRPASRNAIGKKMSVLVRVLFLYFSA